MKLLQDRILKEGRALNKEVLKVDSFLNHAVDPELMYEIGKCFKEYFEGKGITKIFTIESSGIAPTVMTALQMNLPMVTLKKQTSKILSGDVYQTTVHSFTKGSDYELTLSKKYVDKDDKILIIDDFLANGQAALGLVHLMEQAKAEVVGLGMVIEKSFQDGRQKLLDQGMKLTSLARIEKFEDGKVIFAPADDIAFD